MTTSNPQFNRLTALIEQANVDEIRMQLNVPNAKQLVNYSDAEQLNSLFHTIKIPNQDIALQIINLLLDKGANPYHKEENQQTILFYLAKQGRAKIIERLLSGFKFDLNDLDKYGQNPLFWAASFGRLKVAELLIKYGVNVNQIDQNVQTCLFYAARDGQLEMCKFLINRGCKHDFLDKNKKTPLFFARTSKHPSVIEYLASLKETSKSKPVKQTKPVEIKVEKKKKQVVRNQYILTYTNQQGATNEVLSNQMQRFKQQKQHKYSVYDYMNQPELLQQLQMKVDKKANFIKAATRIVTNFLKRPDLLLFKEPVDTQLFSDYLFHVERPMDFTTIKNKLNYNCYQNAEEFKNDVLLIYQNCIKYNGQTSNYARMSISFKTEFLEIYRRQVLNSSIQ